MSSLEQKWSRLGRPKILVVGDLMLDRYLFGRPDRVSPEAPVVVLQETGRDARPGGAANVASLLARLEAEVAVAGAVGDDAAGRELTELLRDRGVDCDRVLAAGGRPTTEKWRFVAQAASRTPHQLLRFDREARDPLEAADEARLLAALRDAAAACDAVVLSDYGKGVLTPGLLRGLIGVARRRGVPVLVDPARGVDYRRYAGATLVAPNRAAAALWAGGPLETRDGILAAARSLREELGLDASVVTLDRDGLAFADGESAEILAGTPRDVCDVTGAGDTVQAALALCLADGWPLRDALALANAAAGLEVERFGASPLGRDEIAAGLLRPADGKLTTLPRLLESLAPARRAGETVVFTNGCFDLLHPGHVQMLQDASELGSVLVVAVNGDASVRRLKGPERPVLGEGDRARMLAALSCVDHVLVFGEDTPCRLVEAIRPDVLVKGGTTAEVVGREAVEAYGGSVVRLEALGEMSTTMILCRARKLAASKASPGA